MFGLRYLHFSRRLNKSNMDFENITEIAANCGEENLFSWQDYSVVAAMLVITASIGLFYGCFGPKQKTASDFLLGGSSMGTFPMAMSLASSFITAIELLGNPAEMYVHGTQFWMSCVAFIFVIPITSYFYLPVYRNLNLTSAYEYLEMRFSPLVRTFAAGLYVLQMVLYTSVAVYAPALALNHDTFQAIILMSSILLILCLGDSFVGGPSIIWDHSDKSDRLEFFNMDPNPTVRHSFWSVVIGGMFYWLAMFCSNQASIQKYMSVETTFQARVALWIIEESDQLLPLYVMSSMGHLKGVPGFFVAGIFSASLGTVASALNSLTAITVKDFINGVLKRELPENKGALIGKWISGSLIGALVSTIFVLWIGFDVYKRQGSLIGALVSTIFVLWIGFGTQAAVASGKITYDEKITSIESCQCLNLTNIHNTTAPVDKHDDEVFVLYQLSYLWYTMIGCLMTIIVGLMSSIVTGSLETCSLESDLTSPPIRWLLEHLPYSFKKVLRLSSEVSHIFHSFI
ncbi:Sodium-coupled monocarboxylate transporter 1 [Blattella germanica]|nr:Sodium-coupled monocarboxylate transporter 1 [Blattella germanica]